MIEVPAARLRGVGGSGEAVHGELVVGVPNPGDELRAAAIDAGATGKILVGGSRASAETLTRARAMGVAGIVLGGVLDKELRDFEAIQRRRREAGGMTGSFGILLVEGFGKVGIDPSSSAGSGPTRDGSPASSAPMGCSTCTTPHPFLAPRRWRRSGIGSSPTDGPSRAGVACWSGCSRISTPRNRASRHGWRWSDSRTAASRRSHWPTSRRPSCPKVADRPLPYPSIHAGRR